MKSAIELLRYTDVEALEFLMKFIEILGRDTLTIGLKKDNVAKVLTFMAEIPGFLDKIKSLLEENKIFNVVPISWFIGHLVRNDIHGFFKEKFQSVFNLLLARNPKNRKCLEIAFGISKTMKSSDGLSIEELENLTPLHDNDYLNNFRKISILPTVQELNCKYPLEHVPNCWADSSIEKTAYDLFDRQFRLLREDMLAPLKEELHKIVDAAENNFMNQKLHSPIAYDIGFNNSCFVKVAFEPPQNLINRLENLKNKKGDMKEFFEEYHKLLSRDSILVFIDTLTKQVMHVGLVVNRDSKELVEIWCNFRRLSVGVFFPNNSMEFIISNLQSLDQPHSKTLAAFAVQSKVSYFSYEPVLKCLQREFDYSASQYL